MVLWNGKQVWEALKQGRRGECQDPHYLKMKVYDEVPFWYDHLVSPFSAVFIRILLQVVHTHFCDFVGDGDGNQLYCRKSDFFRLA
jgi:hypothetical protein